MTPKLGISFSFQIVGDCTQHSIVNVNNQRLTSEAGGQDKGQGADGALLTAGGIGDSDANPVNPFETSCPLGDRSDDELYNLVPFVKNGDSTISVFTQREGSTFRKRDRSSMVRAPGVGTFLSSSRGAGRASDGGRAAATSRLAAYSSASENTMASSPEDART